MEFDICVVRVLWELDALAGGGLLLLALSLGACFCCLLFPRISVERSGVDAVPEVRKMDRRLGVRAASSALISAGVLALLERELKGDGACWKLEGQGTRIGSAHVYLLQVELDASDAVIRGMDCRRY